ncbi:hypothetical protein FDF11_08280 [Clostridium botulinum]|nr:hypothetical protein [Clostridium botulinum]NFR13702.1 hypothetical protein [Clostridium botulinum]NFR42231.1 hypothetical protein [Clostridium botulinum]NFS50671.1 hypothetical protein [Clostridium botulinum]
MPRRKKDIEEFNEEELKFTKEQIIKGKRYRYQRDLISALLVDGNSYSLNEVNELIDKFEKGKVI